MRLFPLRAISQCEKSALQISMAQSFLNMSRMTNWYPPLSNLSTTVSPLPVSNMRMCCLLPLGMGFRQSCTMTDWRKGASSCELVRKVEKEGMICRPFSASSFSKVSFTIQSAMLNMYSDIYSCLSSLPTVLKVNSPVGIILSSIPGTLYLRRNLVYAFSAFFRVFLK